MFFKILCTQDNVESTQNRMLIIEHAVHYSTRVQLTRTISTTPFSKVKEEEGKKSRTFLLLKERKSSTHD